VGGVLARGPASRTTEKGAQVDLQLDEDQQLFWETTSKFLESTCPVPTIREWAEEELHGFPASWWSQGAELGWLSMLVSEEHGGGSVSGNGLSDLILVVEEIGRRVAPGPIIPVNLVAAALCRYGTDAQRDELLGGLVAGDAFATWAIGTTAGPGSTPTLSARRQGSMIVLDGHLEPVEATDLAGLVLVTAEVDGTPINLLVPLADRGVDVERLNSLDLVRRFGRICFSGVTVDEDHVLPGDGAAQLSELLTIAAVLQSAEIAGILDHWLSLTIGYAFDRYTFGRPLASYQALKHRFANLKVFVEASLAVTVAAAGAFDSGSDRRAELASAAKSYVGTGGTNAMHEYVQLHGGIGTTWDHDLHLSIRRVTQDRSLYGTPREHNERIAQILGMGER